MGWPVGSQAPAAYSLAVDLGTSNIVVAYQRAGGPVDHLLVDGRLVMPSGVYADPTAGLLVGAEAEHAARRDPGRYEPHPKRRIDEPTVLLGDSEYPVGGLLSAVLARIAGDARRVLGPPDRVVLSHPATWGAPRRGVLAGAALAAGFGSAGVGLVSEPVAAARYYADVLGAPMPVGQALAVFDMGAGTTDVAIVRRTGGGPQAGFEVIDVRGLEIGGVDLDAAIFAHVGRWAAGVDPGAWDRLARPADPADQRLRLTLLADIRAAKEFLSRRSSVYLHVPLLDRDLPLTQEELVGLARPLLTPAVDLVSRALVAAGVSVGRLAGVFLVGGSCRVPLIAQLIHERVGRPPVVLEQPELVVARGALLAGPPVQWWAWPVKTPLPPVPPPATVPRPTTPRPTVPPASPPPAPAPVAPASPGPMSNGAARRRRPVVTRVTLLLVGLLLLPLLAFDDNGDRPGRSFGGVGAPLAPAVTDQCDLAIGYVASLPDIWAAWNAIDVKRGVDLAVAQHNAAHPACQVDLRVYDTGRNAADRDAANQRATTDPTLIGVVGPMFDEEVESLAPLLEPLGMPMVTPLDITPSHNDRGWRTFHRIHADELVGAAAAGRYLRALPGAPRVFVVDSSVYGGSPSPSSVAILSTVTGVLGDRYAGTYTVENHSRFLDQAISRIRSSGAPVVYYRGGADEAGVISAELRTRGIAATIVTDGGVKDEAVLRLRGVGNRRPPGAAFEGMVFISPDTPAEHLAPEFRTAFDGLRQAQPGSHTAEAYDAANALLSGIAAGHRTRADLLAHLGTYRTQGASGSIGFDPTGDPTGAHWWASRIVNAQLVADRQVD